MLCVMQVLLEVVLCTYIAIIVLRYDLMEVFLVLLCVLQIMVEDEQYCVFTAWTKYL